MTKTEKHDFDTFVNECERWKKELGLIDWEFKYVPSSPIMDELCEERRYRAWVTFDSEAALAVLHFNTKWREDDDISLTDNDIKLSSFHEVCEVLVADLMRLAHSRFGVCEEDLNLVKHKLIHRLEDCIFRRKE